MWTFGRVGISLLIVGLLVFYLPLPVLSTALKRVSLADMGICIGGALCAHFLGIIKWRLQLRAAHVKLGFIDAASSYGAGLFANMWLPSVVGGDVLRTGLAMRLTGRKGAVIVGSLIDRIGDVICLCFLAVLGSFFVPGVLDSLGRSVLTFSAVGLALAGMSGGALLFYRSPRWWPPRVRRQVMHLRIALWRVIQNYRLVFTGLGLSLCIQSIFVLLNAFLGNTIGMVVPLGLWFFAWPLAKLTALIPISLGGLGIQELALSGLLLPFGMTFALTVAQGLLWRGVFIATGLVGGLIWFVLGRINCQGFRPTGRLKGEVIRSNAL